MVAEWLRLKESGDVLSLMQRLRGLKAFLHDWNLSTFGNVDHGIKGVMKHIDAFDNHCRDDLGSQELIEQRRLLQRELWKLPSLVSRTIAVGLTGSW
ncbi:hypothetical protein V6N12_013297 [Hibiscus sabdariffa]|uniref:Uncharacterized protein n=1 Tax=Hibiscus sabdariffa TaxID=183260 RepID=A0ABR2D640_9ROSI